MNVLAEKLEIINWITQLRDLSVLEALKVLKKETESAIAPDSAFIPVTKEELIKTALASEEDIKAGRFSDIESILEEDWDEL